MTPPAATNRPPHRSPSPAPVAATTPAPAAPTPPREATHAVLTDHTVTLTGLAGLPLREHAAVLTRVHDDLASTLRRAEN